MRRRFLLALVSTTTAGALAIASQSATAAPPKKGVVVEAKAADEASAATHKQFVESIKEGSDKYASRDIPGAIGSYQTAVLLEPRNPLGYYYLGEAHLGNHDLGQAESAWLHASQVSDEGSPGLKAKIFFCIADLRERQKRWDDAKASWEQYGELTAKYAEGTTFPGVAKERIASIDTMLAQDKAYEIVRKRIAEEKAKAPH